MKKTLSLFLLIIVASCLPESKETSTAKKKPSKDGVNKSYYPNGTLRAEVPIKDGKKNGLARDYYADGKRRLEIEYVNSEKHGITRMYYQNGNLYEETPYKNGEIQGVKKRFREDGKPSAEAPYHDGEPCMGLKEFLIDGSVKTKYPTIVVTPVDNILKEDRYILRLKMSDNSRNVTFYTGKLENNCLGSNLEQVYQTPAKGVSEIVFYVPHGMFLMEEINIVAKVKTVQGNYYVTQRKHNVAIENR